MGRLEVLNPVEQCGQIFLLLHRICTIDVIEPDANCAHRGGILRPAHLGNELGERGIVGHQHAAHCGERHIGCIGLIAQRQCNRAAQLACHAHQFIVVTAIGPGDGARPPPGFSLDHLCIFGKIGTYACAPAGVAFVAAGGRVVDACGCSRLKIALWIGQHTTMQVVTVGCDFHQTGGCHFTQLRPRWEGRLRYAAFFPVLHWRRGRPVDPVADDCQHGRKLEFTQQRVDPGIKRKVGVVKGKQNRLGRQRLAAGTGRDDSVETHRHIAVAAQPRKLGDECTVVHRIRIRIITHVIAHLVVTQRNERPGRQAGGRSAQCLTRHGN